MRTPDDRNAPKSKRSPNETTINRPRDQARTSESRRAPRNKPPSENFEHKAKVSRRAGAHKKANDHRKRVDQRIKHAKKRLRPEPHDKEPVLIGKQTYKSEGNAHRKAGVLREYGIYRGGHSQKAISCRTSADQRAKARRRTSTGPVDKKQIKDTKILRARLR